MNGLKYFLFQFDSLKDGDLLVAEGEFTRIGNHITATRVGVSITLTCLEPISLTNLRGYAMLKWMFPVM